MTGPPAGAEQTARANGAVRLVVLGGSAPATVQLIDALATGPRELHGIDLVLHGRSAGRLAAVARAAGLRADALGLAMRVTAQEDRAAALAGADVVLNQIRPGGLEQRSADESFPHELRPARRGNPRARRVRQRHSLRRRAAADLGRRRPLLSWRPADQSHQPGRHRDPGGQAGVRPRSHRRLRLTARPARLGRTTARQAGRGCPDAQVRRDEPRRVVRADLAVRARPASRSRSWHRPGPAAAARRAARPLPALLRTSRPDARGPARPADEGGPAARAGQRDPGHLRAGRDSRHLAASGAVVLARGHAGDRRLAARLGVAAHSRPAEPGPRPLAGRRRDRRGPRDHDRPRPGRAAAGRGAARPAARDPGEARVLRTARGDHTGGRPAVRRRPGRDPARQSDGDQPGPGRRTGWPRLPPGWRPTTRIGAPSPSALARPARRRACRPRS